MRRNFILVIVGIVGLVVLVRDIPFIAHLSRLEKERQITRLERDAYVIAGQIRAFSVRESTISQAGAQAIVDDFTTTSDALAVVTDERGRLIASSQEVGRVGEDYANRPEIASALLGSVSLGSRQSQTENDVIVYAAIPIFANESVAGVVRLLRSQTVINQVVDSQIQQLLVAAAVSLLMAVVAGVLLAGIVSSPLRRLESAVDDMAAGRTASVKPEGPRELKSLATQFNRMSERVGQMLELQKRFSGDAAHQLRTPLTALRLRLEQAQIVAESDPSSVGELIEAALRETDRLSTLTERMLQLARAEGKPLPAELVDVTKLCHELAAEWAALAGESGLAVVVDSKRAVEVLANESALREIISNYLDNALNHSPHGSTIEILVTDEAEFVEVIVRDHGPGLSEEFRALAFERFWRAPSSRSNEGSGIGLAIVAQLARAAGLTVELRSAPSGGLDSVVRSPKKFPRNG